jgi:predicted RNase H-like HicB family nuclease
MGASSQITIKAVWDSEAKVWVAESEDVPGLITEAESSDALLEKLRVLVPELLELNECLRAGQKSVDVLIHLSPGG